jgi:hypothetical protein
MTLEEIQKRIDEAGKLPDFQRTSAEELAARKNEDLWSTLAQIGFGMAAGESPNFLTNVGKATAAATPAMQEAIKERRKDTKEERNREFDYLAKKAGIKGDNFKSAYTIFSSMEDREQRLTLEQMRIDAQAEQGKLNRQAQLEAARIPTGGERQNALNVAAFKQHYLDAGNTPAQAEYLARKDVLAAGNQFGSLTPQRGLIESQLEQAKAKKFNAARKGDKQAVANAETEITTLQYALSNLGAGSPMGSMPAPPPGAVRLRNPE